MNNTLIQTGQIGIHGGAGRTLCAPKCPTRSTSRSTASQLTPEMTADPGPAGELHPPVPRSALPVFGHTDLVGSNGYNQRLGLRRAKAVVNYLVSQGIVAVAAGGGGQLWQDPPADPDQRARKMRNRRTVTEVSGFVKNNPLVLNGKYAADRLADLSTCRRSSRRASAPRQHRSSTRRPTRRRRLIAANNGKSEKAGPSARPFRRSLPVVVRQ